MKPNELVPLDQERRTHVTTREAAAHLSLKVDTIRQWGRGAPGALIQPHRLNNRLLWPVSELRRVLGV